MNEDHDSRNEFSEDEFDKPDDEVDEPEDELYGWMDEEDEVNTGETIV